MKDFLSEDCRGGGSPYTGWDIDGKAEICYVCSVMFLITPWAHNAGNDTAI
jgi:hypothetical protein